MKYLLDSNTVSDLYEDATVASHAIVSRLEPLSDTDEVYVSILTVYEFEYRFAKAPTTLKPRIREQITAIRQDLALLPLSETGGRNIWRVEEPFANGTWYEIRKSQKTYH